MQNTKNILVWVLLFTTMQSVVAQKYFEKSISWEKWHEGHKILEQSNGNFIIAGSSTSGAVWHAYTAIIDEQGNTNQINNYLFSNYYNDCNATEFIESGDKLIVAGYINDTMGTSDLYYLQLSENGTLEDSLFVGTDTTINGGFALCATFDGGYFAGGSINSLNSYVRPYLVKINSTNDIQEELIYSQYAEQGINTFTDIHQAINQPYYYAVGKYKSTNFVGKSLLVMLDTSGILLRDTIYSFYVRDILVELDELPDGGFLVVGQSIDADNIKHGLILRLNPDWTVAWYTINYFYDGDAGACFIAPDGNYVIAGSRENIYTVPFNYDGEIVKLNPDGSLRWRRILGGDEYDYIYDAIGSTDGSIVVCGRTASNVENNGANLWVLKLNCMGLLTEPQAAFAAQIDTNALTATFQNLSQFVYPDSTDGGHYIWDFGDGTTSTQINPTHTYAQGGNYSVTLTAVVCSDTSVFVQEVSTWAVGINQINPTNYFSDFYPNPAQNTAELRYQLADNTQAELCLYNINGMLLHQAKLGVGGSYVLNTAPYQSGVYMYTISNNNKIERRGKLVIIK